MIIYIISDNAEYIDVLDAQDSLGKLTREQCEEMERNYEATHYNSWDSFVAAFNDGDISDQTYIKVFD